jgi:hypothetical protein
MRARSRRLQIRVSATALVLSSLLAAAAARAGQQAPENSLREEISRTGVFFRADAPRVLRNPQDPYLPVFLEIINGVEKEGVSKVAQLAREIKRQPVELDGVNVFAKPAGANRRFPAEPLRLDQTKGFTYDAQSGGKPFAIADRMKKTLEIPLGVLRAYLGQHFFGGPFDVVNLRVAFKAQGWPVQETYLRVRLGAPPFPHLPHWYRGDIHYHSGFTDNPAERGYPLSVTRQAALQADLNWVLLSDHSTDLDQARFAEEEHEAAQYRDGRFVFIVGEEVTVTSNEPDSTTTLHMLALPSPDDPDKGFPDPKNAADTVIMTGDGSFASPAIPLKAALSRILAAGGFAYAAHPDDPISPLLRGGSWNLKADYLAPGGKQLAPGLVGVELWNRGTTLTADDARDPYCERQDAPPSSCFQPDAEANQYARLEKGIKLSWLPLLMQGLETASAGGDSPGFKTFIAAGTDAHGDFNYEATMDAVDFLTHSLNRLTGYAENNALGKVTTVVNCPEGMERRGEDVLRALREGRSVVSNGPLLVAGFDLDRNGSLDDPADIRIGGQVTLPSGPLPPLELAWVSSQEFGPLTSIRLIVGSRQGEAAPQEIALPAGKALASDGLFPVDWRDAFEKLGRTWGYIRLEARTRNQDGEEFRCYTNPIWVRVTQP